MTLAQALARRRALGRCGYVPFITAGDPSLKATASFIKTLQSSGADIIELGVPFSDPVADGPVIQAADERALKTKTSLIKVLALIARVKPKAPVIVFTYLNPVMTLGYAEFSRRCAKAGVSGVLVVDLTAEESAPLAKELKRRRLELVLLASPTTSDERLKSIGRASGSIVYYVSREGVTGVRAGLAPNLAARLSRVKKLSGKPLIVGFGVSQTAQARALAGHSAGVVVGSALVDSISRAGSAKAAARALSSISRRIVSGLGV